MLQVRKARPEDAAAIVDFQCRLADETEEFGLDQAIVTKGAQAIFDDPAKGQYWVVEDTETQAVCASLLITYEWSEWRNGLVWWIQSVYVPQEYRRRGVFRLMYGHMRQLVEANDNLKGLRLYVEKENTVAQRVYEELEMTKEHYFMYEWMK